MMRLSEADLSKCRSDPDLRPACPRSVPRANEEEGFGHRARVLQTGDSSVFDVEWGAPYRNRINRRDRPPRFSHMVVHAGESLDRAFAFKWPEVGAVRASGAATHRGGATWGQRRGEIVLAPPYPRGGRDGAHLIFRWSEGGREYAVSMHAWEPVEQAEALLERAVRSIP